MTKVCTVCKRPKGLYAFYKDKQKKDGHRPRCKDCENPALKDYILSPKGKESRLRARRKYALIKKYGITPEEYDVLLQQQEYKCAICGVAESVNTVTTIWPLCVDHCHETGKVRGLLCRACNVGIGSFGDSVEQLQKAIQYLRS